MKDGIVLYFVFLQSSHLESDIRKLESRSEFRKVGDTLLAYINNTRCGGGKTTIEVRDDVMRILGDDTLVLVVSTKEAEAAWYMLAEDSAWLKEYL